MGLAQAEWRENAIQSWRKSQSKLMQGEKQSVSSEYFQCCTHLTVYFFFKFSTPFLTKQTFTRKIGFRLLELKEIFLTCPENLGTVKICNSQKVIESLYCLSGIQFAFCTTTLLWADRLWVMGVGREKASSTGYSQTVSFPSTKQTQFCLASQIAGLSDGKEKQST